MFKILAFQKKYIYFDGANSQQFTDTHSAWHAPVSDIWLVGVSYLKDEKVEVKWVYYDSTNYEDHDYIKVFLYQTICSFQLKKAVKNSLCEDNINKQLHEL